MGNQGSLITNLSWGGGGGGAGANPADIILMT
jgi:hypothetical protein